MQPDNSPYLQPTDSPGRPSRRKVLVALGIAGVLVLVVVLVTSFISGNKFRVTSTTPDITQVSTTAPDITFTFNRPLTKEGLNVFSAPSNIIASTELKDKQLIVNLLPPLLTTSRYTLSLTVFSTDGASINKQLFSFTP
jgi:methionine-rich copper-binding protein CopC